jgi:hypothetical protein
MSLRFALSLDGPATASSRASRPHLPIGAVRHRDRLCTCCVSDAVNPCRISPVAPRDAALQVRPQPLWVSGTFLRRLSRDRSSWRRCTGHELRLGTEVYQRPHLRLGQVYERCAAPSSFLATPARRDLLFHLQMQITTPCLTEIEPARQ